MQWKIQDKKLLIDGRCHSSSDSTTKTLLESALRELKAQAGKRSPPIEIIGIQISQCAATSLFQRGELTEDMLTSAAGLDGGITFKMRLDGEDWPVCIQSWVHFGSYQFKVDGYNHPFALTLT